MRTLVDKAMSLSVKKVRTSVDEVSTCRLTYVDKMGKSVDWLMSTSVEKVRSLSVDKHGS